MKLWPSDSFEVETSLSPDAIVAALTPKIEPTKLLIRFSKNHAPYQGQLSSDGLKITRVIRGRNSIPVISGTFVPHAAGTKVEVHFGLRPFVTAFLYIWFFSVGLSCLVAMLDGKEPLVSLVIPLGMLVCVCASVLGGFWFEATSQRRLLIELFKELEASQKVAPLQESHASLPAD